MYGIKQETLFYGVYYELKCIEKGLAGNSTQGGVGWGRGGGVTT